jgi:hypothetical protein
MYRVLPKANTKFIRPFDLGVHTIIEKPAIVNYTPRFSDLLPRLLDPYKSRAWMIASKPISELNSRLFA